LLRDEGHRQKPRVTKDGERADSALHKSTKSIVARTHIVKKNRRRYISVTKAIVPQGKQEKPRKGDTRRKENKKQYLDFSEGILFH